MRSLFSSRRFLPRVPSQFNAEKSANWSLIVEAQFGRRTNLAAHTDGVRKNIRNASIAVLSSVRMPRLWSPSDGRCRFVSPRLAIRMTRRSIKSPQQLRWCMKSVTSTFHTINVV